MTTHRRTTRPWLLVLALAVVVTSLVALRPSGTTLAAWSDELSVELPTLTTGGLDMSVRAGATSVRIAVASETSSSWQPTAVTVSAGGRQLTGTQLAGTTLTYRAAGADGSCPASGPVRYTAAPGGTGTTFAVTGTEPMTGERTLCLTVETAERLRVSHGGQVLTVTTTVDGVASTWTAAGTWAATHEMPPAPSVSALSCQRSWLSVTLGWSWDHGVTVKRWSVQVRQHGSWAELTSVSAGATRASLSASTFSRLVDFTDYDVRVAAVLPDDTQIASEPTRVGVERFLLGAVYCR